MRRAWIRAGLVLVASTLLAGAGTSVISPWLATAVGAGLVSLGTAFALRARSVPAVVGGLLGVVAAGTLYAVLTAILVPAYPSTRAFLRSPWTPMAITVLVGFAAAWDYRTNRQRAPPP